MDVVADIAGHLLLGDTIFSCGQRDLGIRFTFSDDSGIPERFCKTQQ